MKIGITGANGFIGSHLVKKLVSKNIDFKTFDRNKHDFKKIDSLKDFVKDCNTIFHLASAVTEDAKIINQNIDNTKNLVTAIKEASPNCRVIFTSSFAVYKNPEQSEIIDENFETKPRNNYGKSKLLDENLLNLYSNSVILRLSNVYGPGIPPYKHSVIATFIDQIKNQRLVTINGNGTQTRDFIFIDDVINALMLAVTTKTDIKTINVSAGKDTSIIVLLSLLEEITEKRAKVKFTNVLAKESFWKSQNSLAQKTLGWKPKINLKKGLKLTVNSSK